MTALEVWGVIGGLAGVTWLIRYSFLGLLAGRVLPDWARLALSFVPVTVLPAIAAPMVLAGGASGLGGVPMLLAGAATLAVGMIARSMVGAFGTGIVAYHLAVAGGF